MDLSILEGFASNRRRHVLPITTEPSVGRRNEFILEILFEVINDSTPDSLLENMNTLKSLQLSCLLL